MPDKPKITICDATLRDGSHACSHQITLDQVREYSIAAEAAAFDYLEVGHGNGLGASTLQVGQSLVSEKLMLMEAKKHLRRTRLSVHVIPGFATIKNELDPAIEFGVELFRIGSHCTEADITQRHISHVRSSGLEAWGVLMMSHMEQAVTLLEEAKKMQDYGAQGIVLMDSAGFYVPDEVTEKVGLLVEKLEVPIGFHAHENLGLSIANSLAALNSGARILDGTSRGFGAGAGNAPLELISALLQRYRCNTQIDFYKALDAAETAGRIFKNFLPQSSAATIVSGLSGVFSGFVKPVLRAAKNSKVDPRDIFIELGKRRVVGGQEDLIIEVANSIAREGKFK